MSQSEWKRHYHWCCLSDTLPFIVVKGAIVKKKKKVKVQLLRFSFFLHNTSLLWGATLVLKKHLLVTKVPPFGGGGDEGRLLIAVAQPASSLSQFHLLLEPQRCEIGKISISYFVLLPTRRTRLRPFRTHFCTSEFTHLRFILRRPYQHTLLLLFPPFLQFSSVFILLPILFSLNLQPSF